MSRPGQPVAGERGPDEPEWDGRRRLLGLERTAATGHSAAHHRAARFECLTGRKIWTNVAGLGAWPGAFRTIGYAHYSVRPQITCLAAYSYRSEKGSFG